MTAEELVLLGADKVRNDNDLISLYIEFYRGLFGSAPNCAGCTFKSDWKKFKKVVQGEQHTYQLKIHTMSKDYQIKRKHRNDILTYREGNKPFRIYGHSITDEFAKNFLSKGTDEQIAERKLMFEVTPETKDEATETKPAETDATQNTKVDEATVKTTEDAPAEDGESLTPKQQAEKLVADNATIAEMENFADANGIDLAGANLKSEIQEAILNHDYKTE